jgi:2-keto-4-pentenoate hydratase/2-oxohepta-3-ene-1,7-dioic acid hydratase in catechol pathway
VQEGNTKDLLFGVARLISDLSGIIALHPGDLIFTGPPEGVGLGRTPPLYIRPGQELVSTIEGIGELRQIFVAADEHGHAPRSQRPAPAPEVAS